MFRSGSSDTFTVILGVAVIATVLLLVIVPPPAHALPEYSDRTGDPCATCHVNPGGGGPRTLRGMLWTAQNRPNDVPTVGDTLLAPGVDDAMELYHAACAGCHGIKGEGLFATALTEYYLTEGLIRGITIRGAPRSGMPSFAGQLTDEQLDALVAYVKDLSDGVIVPPDSYILPPALETCDWNLGTQPMSKSLDSFFVLEQPPQSCDYEPVPLTYRGN